MGSTTTVEHWGEPLEVHVVHDEVGRVHVVLVVLAEGDSVRSVQPCPGRHLFFYVGKDGRPVGMEIGERVDDETATSFLVRLLATGPARRGMPITRVPSVACAVMHAFELLSRPTVLPNVG